jgi:hypothetical protein
MDRPMLRPVILIRSLSLPGDVQAQALLDGWSRGSFTLYGWFPGIQGAQELPDGEPVVDLDSVSMLDMLDFAFFGTREVRRDHVGLVFDIAFADLGQDGSAQGALIPGADPASASVDTSLLMATAVAAYRLVEDAGGWADVYGGIRVYDIEVSPDLSAPAFGYRARHDASVDWVDGLVGLRGHVPLGDRVAVTALADVG